MIVFSILAALLLSAGIVLLLELTPDRIADDLSRMISPDPSLRDIVHMAQGKKKSKKLSVAFNHIRSALTDTGKGGQFALVCAVASVCGHRRRGVRRSHGNLFLMPVLAVALAGVPFLYIRSTLVYYEKHVQQEMETALSIITTAYVRSENIMEAVRENIGYIKPPLQSIFQTFLTQATVISADIKEALSDLSQRIDNAIFREWCGCLIQCQDDRTLKSALLPIVSKLSEVRQVNNELRTMLTEPKKEYWMMVAMVVGNVPLLYMINKDWFGTLMYTTLGKVILAICGIAIFVTALFMLKFTKPLEYKR